MGVRETRNKRGAEMNEPTLTIPEGTFRFERSTDPQYFDQGNWICVSARSRDLKHGMIMPLLFQNDLTTIAKERGMTERGNFMRNIPRKEEPKKERAPRGSGGGKTRRNPGEGILGGFNPFAKS